MESKKQDHIEVVNILQIVKQMFTSLLRSIKWLFVFSFKNSMALLAFIVCFIAIGFGIYASQAPYYESELFVSHTRLEDYYCAEMVNNLNLYAKSSDKSELIKKLRLTPEEAELIKGLKYEVVDEKLSEKYADSLAFFLPFKVVASVYDNSVLPKLQNSILNYLESNEYAQKLKEIDINSLKNQQIRLVKEIKEIDTLKQIVSSSLIPRSNGTGIILGEPVNPVLVYDKATTSYKKLMDIDKQQKLSNSFYVIVDFVINNKFQGLSQLAYIFYSALIGYLIGLMWLARKSY